MSRRIPLYLAVLLLCMCMVPGLTMAQEQGGGNGGNGGGGGGFRRGNFDPAQFRERMEQRLKEDLGASDDEWKVIQPKVQKIFEAQRDARGGFGFGFGRRGRGGDNADNQPQTPVARASQDLRNTLQNKDASADEITQKLKALRDAREKAQADLKSAQQELKDVLTPRQEAVLVVNGMLE